MRINLSNLMANLPAQEAYLNGYSPGLFCAIEAAQYQTKSNEVDWNGFTLSEAVEALDMAMNYESQEDVEDAQYDGPPNHGNAIHEFLHNTEVIYNIKHAIPEKQNEEVEFF
jgi:hypothetical protein